MTAPHVAPVRGPALARVEEALEAAGCGPGRRGRWRCPAHDDRAPSLHVAEGARAALIHCFAGCETRAIVDALGLRMADLFDGGAAQDGPKAPRGRGPASRGPRESRPAPAAPEDFGPVTSAQLAWMHRERRLAAGDYDTLDRLGCRRVRWWGHEWLGIPALGGSWKLWGLSRNGVPRRDGGGRLRRRNAGPASIIWSPDLAASAGPVERLLDVEGESDLIAAVSRGMLTVVCGTAGASSLAGHDRHREALLGLRPREAAVIRDLDDTGRRGAQAAAAWWASRGVGVRIVELPAELGEGGDLRDYLLGRRVASQESIR